MEQKKEDQFLLEDNGAVISYKKDNKGEVVITQMIETSVLKEIANEGNGKYINGNKTQETIDTIEDLLLKAEKSEFETKQFSDYKDQFQWFIRFWIVIPFNRCIIAGEENKMDSKIKFI